MTTPAHQVRYFLEGFCLYSDELMFSIEIDLNDIMEIREFIALNNIKSSPNFVDPLKVSGELEKLISNLLEINLNNDLEYYIQCLSV